MSTKACGLVAVMWRCIMVCKVFWNRSTMLAFMSSFSLVKKWMPLFRSTLWKTVAFILDPLSLWTARRNLSISFSMSSMAVAVSVPHLLWRVLTQAYLEKTSIQQNRNLLPCTMYTCIPDVHATRPKMTEDHVMFLKHGLIHSPHKELQRWVYTKIWESGKPMAIHYSTFRLKAKNIDKVIQQITTANKTKQSVNPMDTWRNTNAIDRSKPSCDIAQTRRWRYQRLKCPSPISKQHKQISGKELTPLTMTFRSSWPQNEQYVSHQWPIYLLHTNVKHKVHLLSVNS